ncbi:DsbE family thiol:disulfide interchange protein [Roseateles violae]|uniref:DsbE family thiol:disulfide interchange protein n=1 Tax=Roseateles violae TaxID=3058042 RepID=A0ABT8DM14_9BURK|nr:DsbE family thiol:disulfide interchange protein [Pelomonas sp. PFR6]MDN3919147.1 DsbE family thiol:disulfide interchange protein [Pelomonas sp. PFR6]
MKSRFLWPLGLFLLLAGFLAAGLRLDPREVPSPLIGKPAPAFAATALAEPDRMLRSEDLRGQVWLLNVWASWCGACRDEHPLLLEFARSQQLPIYGLNYKDRREAGLDWLRQQGDPYRDSLFDPEGRIGIDFGVYGVPETFVIDRAGRVRYKQIGPLTPQLLREKIEPLLKELQGHG